MKVNERRKVVVDWPLCPPNRGERSTRMLMTSRLRFESHRKAFGSKPNSESEQIANIQFTSAFCPQRQEKKITSYGVKASCDCWGRWYIGMMHRGSNCSQARTSSIESTTTYNVYMDAIADSKNQSYMK